MIEFAKIRCWAIADTPEHMPMPSALRRSFYLLIAYFGVAAASSWRQLRNSDRIDTPERTVNRLEYATIAMCHGMLTVSLVWLIDIPASVADDNCALMAHLTHVVMPCADGVDRGHGHMDGVVADDQADHLRCHGRSLFVHLSVEAVISEHPCPPASSKRYTSIVLYLSACAGAELERFTKLFFCFTSYMQHGGNAVLVLLEFALNDIR